MDLVNVVKSLENTPYSIELRIENQLTLERILGKLEELVVQIDVKLVMEHLQSEHLWQYCHPLRHSHTQ